MIEFFKKPPKKKMFDRKVLWENDISLLILDERWNSLFKNSDKTPEILNSEEKLKELVKEEARLTAESKEISIKKKICMEKILKLTTEVFENNNETARKDMDACEKEIKRINDRASAIEEALEDIPKKIKDANLELLEVTVRVVYFKMKSTRKRVEELNELIKETEAKLRGYIEERGNLAHDDTEIYAYFHDLLGGEELEKLDKEFFD